MALLWGVVGSGSTDRLVLAPCRRTERRIPEVYYFLARLGRETHSGAGRLSRHQAGRTTEEILDAVADRFAAEQDFHDLREVHGDGKQQVPNSTEV